MHRHLITTIVLTFCFAAAGCRDNEGLLRTQGQLLQGGEPFIAEEEGSQIAITFVPIIPDGKTPASNSLYRAVVDQETGTFIPDGARKKGMPPGTYRVAVELMKKKVDLWGGKFDGTNSPFVFEVDEDTQEIVIDLDEASPGNATTATPPIIESAGR